MYSVKPADFKALQTAVLIIWVLAGVLSESLSVYYVNGSFFISPIEAVFYGCYLSCGPLTAGFCITLTFLFIVTRDEKKLRHIFNTPVRYIVFNITHHLLIMLTVHHLFILLGTSSVDLKILPRIIAAPLFFTLSCVVNALFYKIEAGVSFSKSFKEIFSPYYQSAIPASLAAVIIAEAYPRYGLLALFVMITPILITLISMKNQVREKQ